MLKDFIRSCFTWDFFKKGVRFGIAFIAACLINFGINIGGHEIFGISVNILYPISLVMVSISSFLQFRFFVYPGAAQRDAVKQGWQFIFSCIVFRVCEWLLFLFLYNVIALDFHWWYVGCILIVQATGTITKFFFYNFFIFGRGNGPVEEEDRPEPSR